MAAARQPRPSPMMRAALAFLLALFSSPASATTIYTCTIDGMRGSMVITVYDDGTPARIGTGPGVGDKATIHFDWLSGAIVAVEENSVGMPITITTINRDGRAVHSRQTINDDGWFAPSQAIGSCTKASP